MFRSQSHENDFRYGWMRPLESYHGRQGSQDESCAFCLIAEGAWCLDPRERPPEVRDEMTLWVVRPFCFDSGEAAFQIYRP